MNVIAPWMVKAGISVMAILALGYVVLVQGARNVDANRGVRAAEGIELTSEQATDMTETANSVSALIEDAAIDVSSDLSLSTGTEPSIVTEPETKGIDVSEAPAKSDAWYVRRIEELMDRWGPRYTAAVDDIVKFEHRFETTEVRLHEYFQQQAELTESVNDPNLRAELRNRDSEEQAAYSRWMAEGRRILAEAQAMRRDLDDMNAAIQKQQLTVSMLAEYSKLGAIPNSVRSLHASLSAFRQQSDELARDLSSQVFSAEFSER